MSGKLKVALSVVNIAESIRCLFSRSAMVVLESSPSGEERQQLEVIGMGGTELVNETVVPALK